MCVSHSINNAHIFNYVSLMILWCQYCHTGEIKFQINLKNTRFKIRVHIKTILVNDQLDALFLNVFISTPLHVSSSKCSSSGGSTCINTPSGITHSGSKRV